MTRDIEKRFERMLATDIDQAEKNLMIRDDDGAYHLFGRYQLLETDRGTQVKTHGREVANFTSVRVAVSWCIAEKYRQNRLAQDIERLDQELERMIENHKALADAARRIKDNQRKITTEIKSREAHLRCQAIRERLAECVVRAKYFQIRGFNDEIARTRRPAPNRTNQSIAGKPSR